MDGNADDTDGTPILTDDRRYHRFICVEWMGTRMTRMVRIRADGTPILTDDRRYHRFIRVEWMGTRMTRMGRRKRADRRKFAKIRLICVLRVPVTKRPNPQLRSQYPISNFHFPTIFRHKKTGSRRSPAACPNFQFPVSNHQLPDKLRSAGRYTPGCGRRKPGRCVPRLPRI